MPELLVTLLPILAVDILNPVLFALMVVAAGTRRPVLNGWSLLAGHTLAYFAVGVAVAFGLEQISERLANPRSIDFAIGGVIGLLLIRVFFHIRRGGGEEAELPEEGLTPMRCIGLGALVNFVGSPFALPYFGAIDQILKAELELGSSLVALAIYNLGYALPFAIVPVSVAIAGDRARPLLERINGWLVGASEFVVPWLVLALGAWLVYDAGRYFLAGL